MRRIVARCVLPRLAVCLRSTTRTTAQRNFCVITLCVASLAEDVAILASRHAVVASGGLLAFVGCEVSEAVLRPLTTRTFRGARNRRSRQVLREAARIEDPTAGRVWRGSECREETPSRHRAR
jgi:hypothetical protein